MSTALVVIAGSVCLYLITDLDLSCPRLFCCHDPGKQALKCDTAGCTPNLWHPFRVKFTQGEW